ncbi:MAG: hypoxanthine phosphoribosyltransferase [Bacteriovoracaceae bacterium]|jgi:hypoxanthine phosphoribosyltransferase|nr:hypoxanthine phosphoribosyltransferase [Bacteriovoracaceae bacterium]
MDYHPEVLFDELTIKNRIAELGAQITHDYAGQEIVVVCVLKGAFVFCADLIKEINLPIRLEFISLSSYGDKTASSGEVKKNLDITGKIRGENVLVVEDIVDTGLTIETLFRDLSSREPRTMKLASLLFKPEKLKADVDIDYLAFEIEDQFVIGFGLDYAQRYRELPYIGVLNQA